MLLLFTGEQALPTLVRMCKQDKTWEERVEGAETLAYLIEVDVKLQRTAAISDHLISTLSEYFKYPGSPMDANLMPKVKVAMFLSFNSWFLVVGLMLQSHCIS